ncbi:hemin uptake protein HemP [Rhodoferax sp. AJA081-3]|uniref:hemin uptake protein HemP n=1 Tax=Rhodoferax sp. AJA081-3 TaxID=2752316 RepID=UPI001ADFD19B|nr:hemin uptake protein HemP [Rhodoferax sp. AJA081-3]QTN28857.1 hemin uptake protein HemP [Rhodoferax sp. AJA081-3]
MNVIPKVPGHNEQTPAPVDSSAGHKPSASARVARMPSTALFSGAQEVEIEHHGTVYRLRQTALGKLILTK